MQFTVTQTVEADVVSNLLCSAFEGGSDYWAVVVRRYPPLEWAYTSDEGRHYLHDIPLAGGVLVFQDEGGKEYQLDEKALHQGLQILAEKYPAHFADAMNRDDDADTGDAFLQCCLFGEVIYG